MKLITVDKRQKSKAFTVLELAAVLLIISLVYMTVSPAVLRMMDTAKSKKSNNEITEMQSGIDDFLRTNGRFLIRLKKYLEKFLWIHGGTPINI